MKNILLTVGIVTLAFLNVGFVVTMFEINKIESETSRIITDIQSHGIRRQLIELKLEIRNLEEKLETQAEYRQ